jgi:uncharacterized protein YndB with AHSA1/START domain
MTAERPSRHEITLDAPPAQVWDALTDPDRFGEWFGGEVELDPRPGAPVLVRMPDGSTNRGLVEIVEPPRRFVLRWRTLAGAGIALRVGEPTRVEFTLRPLDGGARTLVIVTEVDAPLPGAPTLVAEARS